MHFTITKLPKDLTRVMRRSFVKNPGNAIRVWAKDYNLENRQAVVFQMNSFETELQFEVPCLLTRPGEGLMNSTGLDWMDSIDAKKEDQRITFSIDGDNRLVMKCGRSTTRLKNENMYFDPMKFDGDKERTRILEVERSVLATIPQAIGKFVGDPTREVLNYICISDWKDVDVNGEPVPGRIVAQGANGYRLSAFVVPTVSYEPNFDDILVKPDAIEDAVKLAEIFEDTVVRIGMTQSLVIFSGEKWSLKSIRPGREFPRTRDVINLGYKEITGKIIAKSSQIVAALKIAEIFAKDMNFSTKMMQDKDGEMIIAGRSAERGDAEHGFPCSSELPAHFPTTFVNCRYLRDGIMSMKSDEVQISVNEKGMVMVCDPNKPQNVVLIMGMER